MLRLYSVRQLFLKRREWFYENQKPYIPKESESGRRFHLHKEESNSLKSTPVKSRWNPEKTENPFINREIIKELENVRQSRPQTLQKVLADNLFSNCFMIKLDLESIGSSLGIDWPVGLYCQPQSHSLSSGLWIFYLEVGLTHM